MKSPKITRPKRPEEKPVPEQLAPGTSEEFWSLIRSRREEPTLSREELLQKIR